MVKGSEAWNWGGRRSALRRGGKGKVLGEALEMGVGCQNLG